MAKQTYPYMTARNREDCWEFYVTIKPGKMTYLQGISKKKLAKIKKKTASNIYMNRLVRMESGHTKKSKPQSARLFYQEVFGSKTKYKSRLP